MWRVLMPMLNVNTGCRKMTYRSALVMLFLLVTTLVVTAWTHGAPVNGFLTNLAGILEDNSGGRLLAQ